MLMNMTDEHHPLSRNQYTLKKVGVEPSLNHLLTSENSMMTGSSDFLMPCMNTVQARFCMKLIGAFALDVIKLPN